MIDTSINCLWLIFGYIGTNWETASFCTMPEGQFREVILWQVQRDPCYGEYYTQAVAEYQVLLQQYGDQQLALQALFTENQLPSPKLPDVANYVLLEFMRWNVAFGGFRAFNYENYNGWMGGGSFLSKPPPYRALPMGPPTATGSGSKEGDHHA
jgi:hypothetical protein